MIVAVPSSDSLEVLARLSAKHADVPWFLVVDAKGVVGVAPRDYAVSASEIERRGWHSIADVMRRDFIFVREYETLDVIIARLHRPHAAIAVVTRETGAPGPASYLVGIITWERVAEVLEEYIDLYSERGERPTDVR